MAGGERRKGLIGPLLLVNLVMFSTVLGIASWSINKFINGETHSHLGGNNSTRYFLIFSLLAGVVGVCSAISGLMHMKGWGHGGLANSAITSGLISWAITTLDLGFACKQITLGNRGRQLRLMESFIMLLTLAQLIYLLLLYMTEVINMERTGRRIPIESNVPPES